MYVCILAVLLISMVPCSSRNVKKLHALFEAIIEPMAPKNISFPMDPEDELTFHASKECLMAYVKQQAHEFDLNDANV